MWVRTHPRKHLADSKVRRTTISWRESSSLSPNTSSGDSACGLTDGGFFHDSPGGPSPRRRFPVTAMSAPGIEHGRFSALVRGSMEHTNRYTKEIGTPKPVTRARQRQAAHGNDTGEGRDLAAGESSWSARPGPVAFVGGEGRGIGRKEAGFLHLEIEIEVHLRLFENLFLYSIMFRLV